MVYAGNHQRVLFHLFWQQRALLRLVLLGLGLALMGCEQTTLQPFYAQHNAKTANADKGTINDYVQSIRVREPQNLSEYDLTVQLESQLNAHNPPLYLLSYQLTMTPQNQIVTFAGRTERILLNGSIAFALYAWGGSELESLTMPPVYQDRVQTFISYNVPLSFVGEHAAERNARGRLIELLGTRLLDQLMLNADQWLDTAVPQSAPPQANKEFL